MLTGVQYLIFSFHFLVCLEELQHHHHLELLQDCLGAFLHLQMRLSRQRRKTMINRTKTRALVNPYVVCILNARNEAFFVPFKAV